VVRNRLGTGLQRAAAEIEKCGKGGLTFLSGMAKIAI
jgi:hypothetical protein